MKFLKPLTNPKVQLAIWGIATLVWAMLLIPSLLWWKDSLLWIIVMSWWANVSASAAACLAAYSVLEQQSGKDEK